jgi:signal transduction histidine kinase
MSFKVQARTLLQLGAELISSDAVALFELIKNAFDAGSPDVKVEVVVRLPDWPGDFPALIEAVRKKADGAIERLRSRLLQHVDSGAPGVSEWEASVHAARKANDVCSLAEAANFILISDTGHGMSRADLDEIYLTIGTRNRLEERSARLKAQNGEKKRPILGEKGLGRLSVMRLGDAVQINTTKRGEARWNLLEIDWTAFAHDIDQSIGDVKVAPQIGETKSDADVCGTKILITNLKAHWDELRLKKYADESVSKLSDPFAPKSRYKVNLRFNGTGVPIRLLETDLLKIASASVDARFDVGGSQNAPRLKLAGTVTYMSGERVRHFAIDDLTHLTATIKVSMTAAWRLGPFSTRVYWFNRQALRERKPDGPELVKWVNSWSGGLMLFRDGFRVHPYGEPDDDWLDLDRKALASGGYKVNRKQLIGKVEITSDSNPALTDQTNRQGLRDCPEKEALIALLKHILERELRVFLNEIANEKRAAIDLNLDELTQRAAEERERLQNNFKLLKAKHPKIREEKKIIAAMDSAIDELEQIMAAAQEKAEEMNEGRAQLVHLAGLGLLVEMIAHELNRSTRYALAALESTKDRGGKTPLPASLSNLELQLKTLEKRLKTLDPATTSGRQRKESFDVVQLTREIVEGHSAELQRHHIVCDVRTRPPHARLTVKMVKGMIVQVLENLLDNSLYWLKQHKLVDPGFEPEIVVEVDAVARELRVTDNGPGVLESFKDRIFQPFFTTKPPGLGKGLGLFIARDVARYHDATLTLSDEQRTQPGRYNTFVLSLPEGPSA